MDWGNKRGREEDNNSHNNNKINNEINNKNANTNNDNNNTTTSKTYSKSINELPAEILATLSDGHPPALNTEHKRLLFNIPKMITNIYAEKVIYCKDVVFYELATSLFENVQSAPNVIGFVKLQGNFNKNIIRVARGLHTTESRQPRGKVLSQDEYNSSTFTGKCLGAFVCENGDCSNVKPRSDLGKIAYSKPKNVTMDEAKDMEAVLGMDVEVQGKPSKDGGEENEELVLVSYRLFIQYQELTGVPCELCNNNGDTTIMMKIVDCPFKIKFKWTKKTNMTMVDIHGSHSHHHLHPLSLSEVVDNVVESTVMGSKKRAKLALVVSNINNMAMESGVNLNGEGLAVVYKKRKLQNEIAHLNRRQMLEAANEAISSKMSSLLSKWDNQGT